MKVRDVMTPDPITLPVTGTIQDALDLMVRHDIHALPVVDDAGLAGIITDRDVKMMLGPGARSLVEDELDEVLLQAEVSEAMTPEVLTVGPDTPLSRVARKLATWRVGDIPVVEGDALVGIVSVTDVLLAAAELFEREE